MPEGDTLHRAAANLAPRLIGKRLAALEFPRAGKQISQLRGRSINRVEARGKNLLIHFEGDLVLHTHLRMNGVWRGFGPGDRRPARSGSVVVWLETDDGSLAVCWRAPIVRLLRAKALAADPQLGSLGPDPIAADFDPDRALARLRMLDGEPLGVALVDQRAIAGIGNIWKSELLFEHRLDPFAPVARFTDGELRSLLESAARGVRPAVKTGMRPRRAYGRAGRACGRCGGPISMARQGALARSTYWCERCQPPRHEPAR